MNPARKLKEGRLFKCSKCGSAYLIRGEEAEVRCYACGPGLCVEVGRLRYCDQTGLLTVEGKLPVTARIPRGDRVDR